MNRWETGMLAKSLAGHDKNKIYVIADQDEMHVYLIDGNTKTSENKKKKKKIHAQLIKKKFDIDMADNASVRRVLIEYANRNEGGNI